MEEGGQLHAPAALPRYPLYRRLGGPQGRSGRVEVVVALITVTVEIVVVMEVADLDVFMYSVSSEQPSYYIAS
jgi:hypothetical protein